MEVYARELIPELVAAAPKTRFTAFVNREAADVHDAPWGELIPRVLVPVSARNRFDWVRGEQQLLPRLAARAGVDLIHSLGGTAPGWGRYRRVVTIHDLAYRLAPEAHLGVAGLGMRVLVPLAAHRSHRIIVPSAATGRDVGRVLRIPAARVTVIPEGVGTPVGVSPLPERELRTRLGAGHRPIVLCVAAKRPHKNLARLVGAMTLFADERRPLLVLPGYSTAHERELREHAARLGVAEDIRFLGWVDPAELEGLYAAAACFVFPSLFEGFGLPVLEAMARGVPVACSQRGALAEVAGDAAVGFDPESDQEIASAVERLLTDPDEAARRRAAGLRRASQFSWAGAAAETLACYRLVVGEPDGATAARPAVG
jgi:glycosyltransferase involved in cell wall biosynthesis